MATSFLNTLPPSKKALLLPKEEDTPAERIARARAFLVGIGRGLWDHKQKIRAEKPKYLTQDELPSTNSLFTSAIAECVLRFYDVPYRVVVGSIHHETMRDDASYPWVWLESPHAKRSPTGQVVYAYDEEWDCLTDIAVFAMGRKKMYLAGQSFNPGGVPKASDAVYHAAYVFDPASEELIETYEAHADILDEDTSLPMMVLVAGSLRDCYVLAMKEEMRVDGPPPVLTARNWRAEMAGAEEEKEKKEETAGGAKRGRRYDGLLSAPIRARKAEQGRHLPYQVRQTYLDTEEGLLAFARKEKRYRDYK